MNIKIEKGEVLQFKEVILREPVVEDLIQAERMVSKSGGIEFALAVLSRIAKFDGQTLVPEDLRKLRVSDFLNLSKAIESFGLEELAKELLDSAGKEASATAK